MSLRNRLAFCLILSACTGGQGGDPGQAMGGGPGVDPDDSFCTSERWLGPDAARLSGECEEQAPGSFRCQCGDDQDRTVLDDVRAERCSDALRDGCAVDIREPRFCEVAALGTCWPVDASAGVEATTWSCRCEGSDALVERDTAICTDALAALCTERCESAFGTCQQSLSAPASYACSCTGDSSAPPALAFASCDEALATTCGERCTSEAGSCAIGDDETFDCACSSGDEVRVTLDELGGAQPAACGRGLIAACGEVLPPPISGCESSSDGHDARCEALPKVQLPGEQPAEEWRFSCACDGASVEMQQALTCFRALLASCPDALPPGASQAEPGELGALCESADDCDLGACYVPGNQLDPICSADCDDDTDCPEGALCSFVGSRGGHCFPSCESDAECGLLNDAQENPLYCANRADIDFSEAHADEGGRVCVQHSEP